MISNGRAIEPFKNPRTVSIPKVLFFRLRFYFRLWNVTEKKENGRPNEIERVENVHFICHKFSRLRFHIFSFFARCEQSLPSFSSVHFMCATARCVCVWKMYIFQFLPWIFLELSSFFLYAFSSREREREKKANQPLLRDKMLVCTSVFAPVRTDCQTQFHFSLCHSIRGKAKSIQCM